MGLTQEGSRSERVWAVVAPLSLVFCFLLGPVLMLAGPGRTSAVTNDAARRALDFQITFYLALLASAATSIFFLQPRGAMATAIPGFTCYGLVYAGGFLVMFMVTVDAVRGRRVSYPFSLRLFSRDAPEDTCTDRVWRERSLASLSQLSLVGFPVIAPLIIFALARHSPFARRNAARAFNFQLLVVLVMLVSGFFLETDQPGLVILPALIVFVLAWIGAVVLSVRAAVRAWRGSDVVYPISFPLLRDQPQS